MEKETTKLIEELASKLGTTSEYLWEILVKQAFVSSCIDIVQYIILGIACYIWTKYFNQYKILVKEREDEEYMEWLIWITGLVLLILLFVAFFAISYTITGFVNPEAKALKQVIEYIK